MRNFLVLGSGIALGVYVPALSLKKQLERLGDHADFMCLEELYRGKDGVMEETKRSFHNDFRLAKISYRLPVRNQTAVDPEAERAFLNAAAAKRYDAVITFSGFFSEILKKLMAECPYYRGRIHAVHMDAGTSLSWKKAGALDIDEIWLYRLEDTKILRCLEKPEVCPEKQNRILVHGGGWGIGEYRDIIRDLNAQGFPLDIVVYLCLQHIIHTFQGINRFVFCLDDRLLVIQIFAECLILYHQIGTDRHVADKVVVSGNVVRLEFAVLSKIIQGHAEKISQCFKL